MTIRRAPTGRATPTTSDAATPRTAADERLRDDLGYQVWLDLVTDGQQTTAYERDGVTGQLWHGTLEDLVDRVLAAETPARAPDGTSIGAGSIVSALIGQGVLAVLGDGRVWVADDWRAHQTKPAPSTKSAKSPLGPKKKRRQRRGRYPCRKCAFVGTTSQSIAVHLSKLGDRPHPTGRYPCAHCPAVHASAKSAGRHLSTAHHREDVVQADPPAIASSQPGDPAPNPGRLAAPAAAEDPYASLRLIVAANAQSAALLNTCREHLEQASAALEEALRLLNR